MPVRTIAPPAPGHARAATRDDSAGLPELTVVATGRRLPLPAGVVRREELDAALRQQVRELAYTLRRGTIPQLGAVDGPGEAIEDLARVVFADREESRRRTERVSRYLVLLADAVGFTSVTPSDLRLVVVLRELGQTGMPHGLVTLPEGADRSGSDAPSMVVRNAAAIAVASHEWWDGSGYPRGLRGDEIPEIARLAAVVEVFDALTGDRRRRPGLRADDVATIMRDLAGRRFEPHLVAELLGKADEVHAIRAAFPDRALALKGPAARSHGRLQPTDGRLGESLTRREMEVLGLVAAGLPNKQIAHELGLRLNTVRNHVQNVLYKLRSHSKLEAVATAVRERLISYPAP